MRNYYHILLETPLGNLSDIMLMFNREFARMYNKLENRKGSVFKQRYKAILIEKEEYYLNVLRYISQNPIRPRLCSKIMTL
jgi:REP element-mobilizing transposase RayT